LNLKTCRLIKKIGQLSILFYFLFCSNSSPRSISNLSKAVPVLTKGK